MKTTLYLFFGVIILGAVAYWAVNSPNSTHTASTNTTANTVDDMHVAEKETANAEEARTTEAETAPKEMSASETTQAMEASSTMLAHDTATTSSVEPADSIKEFHLNGFKYGYDPKEITVNEGDTVKIVLTSTDGLHDWVVDEFNATSARVRTGETTEVTFVADKAGTYEYYCSVGNHRALGMVGTLTVTAR